MRAVRKCVFDERLRPPQAFRLRRPHKVTPQDIEHGVALVTAVEGESLQNKDQRRQDQMLNPIHDTRPGPRLESRRIFAGVVNNAIADEVIKHDSPRSPETQQELRC